MVSPRSAPKPALHLNTNIERLRPGGVHFDAPLRPRASTRGSPPETIDSPPILSPPDYESSGSDSESECWMRGRPSGDTARVGLRLPFGYDHQDGSNAINITSPNQSSRPLSRAHTNLFGMLASSATFNEMDLTSFRGHRGTLATLTLRRVKHSIDLPIEIYARLLRFLDFQSYKSMRLTCRCWSAALTYIRPLRLPPVYALPAEIIKHVYSYLSPLAMNAMRHTCRKYMTASLEYRLLAQVMKRVGFWRAVEADTARNEQLGHPVGGEWRLSKRLATECSLCRPNSLSLNSTIDFSKLLQSASGNPTTLRFIVSNCCKFLLVLDASVINVYCIRDLGSSNARYEYGGHLELLIRIACPGTVLALSMDTSQDRYSIAVLLEDRKGLVIDVPELSLMARRSGSSSPHSERDTRNVTEDWDAKASPTATPTTSQRPRLPVYTDVYHTSPVGPSQEFVQPSPVPFQFIPHTLYRNLCSKTSPPLTVAIAPHRRCVAFGSSAGIELHWQDATTGLELNRWMGLIGPAEYIHFLPPRKEDEKDLSKTLRLTASRAGPTYYHDPLTLNEAWDYEHCKFLRAVPLSDGQHLFYTDPDDGNLYLGTGLHHPFGGPKPIKKFIFQRPRQSMWPRCYKAGMDLRWGARVAVAFGNDIWLYCVPPDWLAAPPQSSLHGNVEYNKHGMVVVRGVEIETLPDLVELAIDTSNGEVTIHAFSTTHPARVYQMRRYPTRSQLERSVGVDGMVVDMGLPDTVTRIRDFAPFLDDGSIRSKNLFTDLETEVKYTGSLKLDIQELPVRGVEDETNDIEMRDLGYVEEREIEIEIEDEDEGYVSGVEEEEEGDGEWRRGADDEDADMGFEDGWGEVRLVRLEVEVLCGG
ncbi:MAG: hypothetical protein Q9178_006761 [Gyalolechia marmorata]